MDKRQRLERWIDENSGRYASKEKWKEALVSFVTKDMPIDENILTYTATPTIGFPHKTRWLKRPIGWEDLGRIKVPVRVSGRWYHDFCGDVINIGKQDGKLFKFCSRCLVKVE